MYRRCAVISVVVLTSATLPSPAHASRLTLHDAIVNYLKTRHGTVTVAVHDYVANRDYVVYHERVAWTASVVKVEILETLLHQNKGHLSSSERANAKRMIENSDNDAAEDLWEDIGEGRALDAFSDLAELTSTHSDPRGRWGRTITGAQDQLKLIQLLETGNKLLTDDSRRYVKSLMHNVESDQRWGACAHHPSDAWTMNKNGWSPIADDSYLWTVNSDCYVHGKTKRYSISVLDKHNSSESYAITTIEGVAAIVVKYMKTYPT